MRSTVSILYLLIADQISRDKRILLLGLKCDYAGNGVTCPIIPAYGTAKLVRKKFSVNKKTQPFMRHSLFCIQFVDFRSGVSEPTGDPRKLRGGTNCPSTRS